MQRNRASRARPGPVTWRPLLCVLRHAVLTLTLYLVVFTSMASRPIVFCTFVSALPSTRSALLSSSAHATFFVVASGSAVCKRERPPRLRDKGGGESLGRGLTTEETVSARSLDNRSYKFL